MNILSQIPIRKFSEEKRGFTLIELMVTIGIIILVSTLGFISLSGYIPKQRLITTGRYLENTLTRAQSEAYSRGQIVGVQILQTGAETKATVFRDDDSDWALSANENITEVLFRSNVYMVKTDCQPVYTSTGTSECTDASAGTGCYVYFDGSGQAVDSSNNPADFQLTIYTPTLDNVYNAREVEVLSTGLVELIKQAQAGNALKSDGTAHAASSCNE